MFFGRVNPEKKFTYRKQWWAYGMLIPGFIMMTIFVVIPLVMAIYRSFLSFGVYDETPEFVGFRNYEYILSDPTFIKSLGNVVLFAVIITVSTIVLAFLFAVAIKALNNKLTTVAKIIIYLPFLLSGVVASIMFAFIFNYGGGLINSIMISLGLDPIAFGKEGIWPYLLIILPSVWLGFGYNTLVLYAGLMNIPKSYYEAADIDGASFWRKLFKITIPNMKNYFVLLVVNLITANLQMFDIPLMMTGGGPDESTLTTVLYIYNLYRDTTKSPSISIAASVILMVPIVIINLLVFKLIRSEKSQDA